MTTRARAAPLLLVIDGDSFAHRAFHALPKLDPPRRRPARRTCSPGFTSMLLRLWQAEQPRAVVVGWDTLDVPTYRHELLAGYQSGREFDPELARAARPRARALLEAPGIVCGKAAGYEADDFLAAAVASERARGRHARSSRPPTATRSSSPATTSRSSSRCAA